MAKSSKTVSPLYTESKEGEFELPLDNNLSAGKRSGYCGPHQQIPPAGSQLKEASAIDRALHAHLGKFTAGLSPAALALAYFDWATHLILYPGRQLELIQKAWQKLFYLHTHTMWHFMNYQRDDCFPTMDKRFSSKEWKSWPFNFYSRAFLNTEEWWEEVARTRGVTRHHEDINAFITRQLLNVYSPSNFPATNPDILQRTLEQSGMNFIQGTLNAIEDFSKQIAQEPPVGAEKYQVGMDVAVTPGKVIYRNRLIELIQYTPTTEKVYAEPLLIVPAWIMKYYILDLSPHNSLVRYLVENGHTVFMISWKNPAAEDRDLSMDDYFRMGVMDAINVISTIIPECKIHAVGYCIGGTLLSIAAADMAANKDNRLQTITLFAAQTDFEEAGELLLFIDESQLTYLEDLMWEQGYLEGHQMSGAFLMLRSRDLVWSRMVQEYMMGSRQPMFDLMAWNTDATRMPYTMYSEYLRNLFLNNDLAEGRYKVEGKEVALTDIQTPIFAVSTLTDHIAPWKSVYKIHLFVDSEVTFLLTSGGHNAGVISEPGHKGRTFQRATSTRGNRYIDPLIWEGTIAKENGSWWPSWQSWIAEHSSEKTSPPPMGAPEKGLRALCAAPGIYVLTK